MLVALLPLLHALTTHGPVGIERRRALALAAASQLSALPLCARAGGDSLQGATALVTAGHEGLGFETASRLLSEGARVIITARRQKQTDRAVDQLAQLALSDKLIGMELDLASLESIRSFPMRLQARLQAPPAIDVLVNRAQGESPFNSERTETADGFERTIGVSHLGHFALFCELLPALKRAAAAHDRPFRVICLSSKAHRDLPATAVFYAIDSKLALDGATTQQFERYRLAKVANVLFALELRNRIAEAQLRGSAVAVGLHDPRDELLNDPRVAAELIVRLAAADERAPPALYVSSESGKSEEPSAAATNPLYARNLWAVSEMLTGERAAF